MNISNQMTVIGNIGRDIEINATKNGNTLAKFSIAINEKRKDGSISTTWMNIQAWGELAKSCQMNLKKGDRIIVIGKYTSSSYKTQIGETKYFNCLTAEIIAKPISSGNKNNKEYAYNSTNCGLNPSYDTTHQEARENEEIPF